MLLQHRVETFYDDGTGDRRYYAISNSDESRYPNADGDVFMPGLNVSIPGLTWKQWSACCWPRIQVDGIGYGVALGDEVLSQILFGLFCPDDDREDIGWKITGIELLDANTLSMTLRSEHLYRMREYLQACEWHQGDRTGERPDFTSEIPSDQYLVYWSLSDAPERRTIIVVEPSETDARRYELSLSTYVRIEETSPTHYRKLEFSNPEEKEGEYGTTVKVDVYEALL